MSLNKLNVSESLDKTLPARDYVLPSFPLGKVGLLASAGGTGKSFYALQMAFQVALGQYCDFNLGSKLTNEISNVMYVSLEDEAVDIEHRLQAIHEFYEDERKTFFKDAADFIYVYALSGCGSALIDSKLAETAIFKELKEEAKKIKGLRLIVIDTLRRAHDADENSNGDMSVVLRSFESLAKHTGASVLLLHHENKMGMNDKDVGAGSSRGASAIVDNARYAMRLQTMTPKEAEDLNISDDQRSFYVSAKLVKTNYGPPQPEGWLSRERGGVLQAMDKKDDDYMGGL